MKKFLLCALISMFCMSNSCFAQVEIHERNMKYVFTNSCGYKEMWESKEVYRKYMVTDRLVTNDEWVCAWGQAQGDPSVASTNHSALARQAQDDAYNQIVGQLQSEVRDKVLIGSSINAKNDATTNQVAYKQAMEKVVKKTLLPRATRRCYYVEEIGGGRIIVHVGIGLNMAEYDAAMRKELSNRQIQNQQNDFENFLP